MKKGISLKFDVLLLNIFYRAIYSYNTYDRVNSQTYYLEGANRQILNYEYDRIDIMIKFGGELSTKCRLYAINRDRRLLLYAMIILMTPLVVLNIIMALNINIFLLLFVPVFLIVIIASYLYKPKVQKSMLCHIEINEEIITMEVDEKYSERKIWDVKRIIDYGELYVIEFYFPGVLYTVCQKNLIVEGTLDEFEHFFDVKIIKKNLKH